MGNKTGDCIRGVICDVALDLCPESPRRGRWFATETSTGNSGMLYIAEGCAHGYQTLTDDGEVLYWISHSYHAAAMGAVRWNDPSFAIAWPLQVDVIPDCHHRCSNWPGFSTILGPALLAC